MVQWWQHYRFFIIVVLFVSAASQHSTLAFPSTSTPHAAPRKISRYEAIIPAGTTNFKDYHSTVSFVEHEIVINSASLLGNLGDTLGVAGVGAKLSASASPPLKPLLGKDAFESAMNHHTRKNADLLNKLSTLPLTESRKCS